MSDNVGRLSHLDALRGFAIILVVGIHATGYAFSKAEGVSLVLNPTFNLIIGIAVPIFYMVDGFLTARSQSRKSTPFSETALKSARRLLIPWLIFNLFYISLRYLAEWRGIVPDRMLVGRSPADAFGFIWTSQIASQLYFLPTLFLMRLAAVPCRRIFTGPIAALIVFGLAYVGVTRGLGMRLEGDPISHAVFEFPYFIFGCLVFRLESAPTSRGMTILYGLGLAAIVQQFAPLPEAWNQVSYDVAKYGFVLLAYFGSKWVAGERSPLLWLGGRTMEIYLLHAPLLIKVVGIVLAKFIGPTGTRFAAVWSVTLLVTVALTLVLSKIPWTKRLFGGA